MNGRAKRLPAALAELIMLAACGGPDSYSWFVFEIGEVEYYLDMVQFF